MDEEKVIASPAIRRIAKQYGIDLTKIGGTGEGGRIEVSDLERYLLGRRRVTAGEAPEEKVPEAAQDTEEVSDDEEYVLYKEDAPGPVYSKLNYDDEDYVTLDTVNGFDIELYPEDSSEEEEDVPDEEEEYVDLETVSLPDEEELLDISDSVADELRADLMKEAEDVLGEDEEENAEEEAPEEEEADEDDFECPGDCEECEYSDDCPIEIGCEEDDEDECGCGEHHHHHDDEDEEECQPIAISFRVPRENADTLVYASGSDHEDLMMDLVIKSLALAIYDEDPEFDGIINLIRFTKEGIEVSTAVDALQQKVGYIEYQDPFDHEDVFVNVWDMTSFGFTSFTRPDAGMVNVFVSADSKDLIIDSVSDEYTVCIDTCAFMMKSLKENLTLPAKMNERSVTPLMPEEEE